MDGPLLDFHCMMLTDFSKFYHLYWLIFTSHHVFERNIFPQKYDWLVVLRVLFWLSVFCRSFGDYFQITWPRSIRIYLSVSILTDELPHRNLLTLRSSAFPVYRSQIWRAESAPPRPASPAAASPGRLRAGRISAFPDGRQSSGSHSGSPGCPARKSHWCTPGSRWTRWHSRIPRRRRWRTSSRPIWRTPSWSRKAKMATTSTLAPASGRTAWRRHRTCRRREHLCKAEGLVISETILISVPCQIGAHSCWYVPKSERLAIQLACWSLTAKAV